MSKMYKFIMRREMVMKGIFLFCAIFSILALLAITVYLLGSGVPFIAKIGFFEFVFGKVWLPLADAPLYGIFPMIVSSLYVTALSVAVGVSIGLFSAICLFKFCPKRLVAVVKQMISLLAGIPSVIYGLFGLIVVVPFFRDFIAPNGVGYGIMSASIVLAIMILPTIVNVSLDSLNFVPSSYYEGALALGANPSRAVFSVVLTSAKSGILAGVVLAIGRAIGETMAVIMVIGGSAEMPNSLFQSVRTMTANIAMGATELSGDALSALIATGVVLFVFSLLLNVSFSLLKDVKIGGKTKKNGNTRQKGDDEKLGNKLDNAINKEVSGSDKSVVTVKNLKEIKNAEKSKNGKPLSIYNYDKKGGQNEKI